MLNVNLVMNIELTQRSVRDYIDVSHTLFCHNYYFWAPGVSTFAIIFYQWEMLASLIRALWSAVLTVILLKKAFLSSSNQRDSHVITLSVHLDRLAFSHSSMQMTHFLWTPSFALCNRLWHNVLKSASCQFSPITYSIFVVGIFSPRLFGGGWLPEHNDQSPEHQTQRLYILVCAQVWGKTNADEGFISGIPSRILKLLWIFSFFWSLTKNSWVLRTFVCPWHKVSAGGI